MAAEAHTLRQMLDGLSAQAALAEVAETHLTEAAALLARLQGELAEIERTNDEARKREIVEQLVVRMQVRTDGTGREKQAEVTIRYAFGQPYAVPTGREIPGGTSTAARS